MFLNACEQSEQLEIPKPLTTQAVVSTPPIPKGQLSKDIVPKHIYLDLTIIPDETIFQGKTKIIADINQAQKQYYIHGNLLEVSEVSIKTADNKVITGQYKQVDKSGIALLTFPETLKKGQVELSITYKAPFNESLEGLYKVNDGGINYAFTQFESISARLAFPGFDEPGFKVPFNISLTVKADQVALSNTPVKKEILLDNGMKKIDFMTTKPLPAYLVAFVVGEFDVVKWDDMPITNVRDRPVALSGIATKGKGKDLQYALEHTHQIVEGLENYFNIPYPYKKLDIVAVPDFAAGAMENAALITYREQLLLLDDKASQEQIRRYMMVHAHELAHQWFGDLVTPYWWNDIWLNEAFATWMSYTALQNVYPEQNFDQDITNRSLGVMKSDSLISARQIRQPIKSNHDISSAFDGITYSKGAGVLEMMNNFLTPQQFRNGIHDYMTQYAFKNATADDFIHTLSQASQNIPADLIRSAFNSFLEQPGIPYLSIQSSCEDSVNTITLSQSRYLPMGSKGSTEQTWEIPACVSYEIKGKKYQDCEILDQKQQEFKLSGKGCADYIMPNSNGSGYYRYALSAENWKQLYANLTKLSSNEAMSLNDSFSASVDSGKIDFSTLMKVAPIIVKSDLNSIAIAPMAMITHMKEDVAGNNSAKQKLADKANQLYAQKFQELGFKSKTNDTVEDTKLRSSVVEFLADTGNNQTIRKQLKDMAYVYTGYSTDGSADGQFHEDLVDTNLLGLAIQIAVEDSDQAYTNHLIQLFDDSNDGTLRGRLLKGISASKNPEFIKQLRDWVLSDRLRDNEIYSIISSQVYDNTTKYGMWKWVKDNFEPFKNRVPIWNQGRMPNVGSGFCTDEKKQDLIGFFNPIIEDLSGGPRYLAQTIEGIDLCIAKLPHEKDELNVYLKGIK